MKLLLDSSAWIKIFDQDPAVNLKIIELIDDSESELFISVASIWEVAIKVGIQKLKLKYDLERDFRVMMEKHEIELLPLSYESAIEVRNLPKHHGDPFDRIQVCQAQEHGLEIVSADPIFEKYGIKRWW